MDIKNVKLLGGIGVLLALFSIIPGTGLLFAIAGLVLVFLAIDELSKKTNNRKIYDNFLVSFILGIVGSVFAGILNIGASLGRFFMFYSFGIPEFGDRFNRLPWKGFREFMPEPYFNMPLHNLRIGLIILAIVFGLILYGIFVVRGYYLKKSYEEIAKETKVEHFKTAGNLIFLGSIFSIVLVGFVIYFIGYVFEIVAFFSLKDTLEIEQTTPPPLPQS